MSMRKPDLPRPTHPAAAYRREGDTLVIELSLRQTAQIFNSLDPSPFHEKELDSDAARYIADAVRDIGVDQPIKLSVELPAHELRGAAAASIGDAIRYHFAYRLQTARRDLRLQFRRGRTSLLIGLLFLFTCMALREVAHSFPQSAVMRILAEGLLILGWVAMWSPLEVFLYGWWPIVGERRLLERLAVIDVELLPLREGIASTPIPSEHGAATTPPSLERGQQRDSTLAG